MSNDEAFQQAIAGKTMHEIQRMAITGSMTKFGGDKERVAHELGLSLKTIYNKLAEYDQETRDTFLANQRHYAQVSREKNREFFEEFL